MEAQPQYLGVAILVASQRDYNLVLQMDYKTIILVTFFFFPFKYIYIYIFFIPSMATLKKNLLSFY